MQSNEDSIKQRMAELCEPIDKQIMMCDNKNDILMLGCAMLEKVKNINIGVEGRKIILKEANDR